MWGGTYGITQMTNKNIVTITVSWADKLCAYSFGVET